MVLLGQAPAQKIAGLYLILHSPGRAGRDLGGRQQRSQDRCQLIANFFLAAGIRMQAIRQQQGGIGNDGFHKEGDQRDLVLLGQLRKDGFKLTDVTGAIVGGNADLGQQDASPLLLDALQHLLQILPSQAGR